MIRTVATIAALGNAVATLGWVLAGAVWIASEVARGGLPRKQ